MRAVRSTLEGPEHDRLRAAVKELRTAAGLSCRKLSIKLGKAPTYIARIERGERTVELMEFVELCRSLGADPLQMLKGVLG